VVSIDARDGEVRTDGWTEGSGVRAIDLAHQMADLGVPRVMFTDIGRDGLLTEPNFYALAAMVQAISIPVVASGGVTSIVHLQRLAEIGCEGAIVGKALYEGLIDLPAALAALRS
jgi:phosphoribosylformimino-5-aminoimidazole carboxamide ribotide isomerase